MIEVAARMNKLVEIYERKEKLFITPYHKTEAGFWVGDEDTIAIDKGDVAAIASATIAALSKSREGMPTSSRDSDRTASLLSAAGVASFNTFAKSAKSVSIELIDGILEITPDQNKGPSEGFVPMVDKTVRLKEGDSSLGSAIVAALNLAG